MQPHAQLFLSFLPHEIESTIFLLWGFLYFHDEISHHQESIFALIFWTENTLLHLEITVSFLSLTPQPSRGLLVFSQTLSQVLQWSDKFSHFYFNIIVCFTFLVLFRVIHQIVLRIALPLLFFIIIVTGLLLGSSSLSQHIIITKEPTQGPCIVTLHWLLNPTPTNMSYWLSGVNLIK